MLFTDLLAGVVRQLRQVEKLLHGVDVTDVFGLADLEHRTAGGKTKSGAFRFTEKNITLLYERSSLARVN